MSCCTEYLIGCILKVLNGILALTGIIMIILAAIIHNMSPPPFVTLLYVVGGICLVAALLGILGICFNSAYITAVYAGIILILFLLQLGGLIFGYHREGVKEYAASTVEEAWQEEIKSPGAMDKTQQTYFCCGQNGPNDYTAIGRKQPKSCYAGHMELDILNNRYETGCKDAAAKRFLWFYDLGTSGSIWVLVFTGVVLVLAAFLVWQYWH